MTNLLRFCCVSTPDSEASSCCFGTVILGVLVHLGIELPLGFVGLCVVPVYKVCLGQRVRQERTCATGWGEVPVALKPG